MPPRSTASTAAAPASPTAASAVSPASSSSSSLSSAGCAQCSTAAGNTNVCSARLSAPVCADTLSAGCAGSNGGVGGSYCGEYSSWLSTGEREPKIGDPSTSLSPSSTSTPLACRASSGPSGLCGIGTSAALCGRARTSTRMWASRPGARGGTAGAGPSAIASTARAAASAPGTGSAGGSAVATVVACASGSAGALGTAAEAAAVSVAAGASPPSLLARSRSSRPSRSSALNSRAFLTRPSLNGAMSASSRPWPIAVAGSIRRVPAHAGGRGGLRARRV
ncbi:uncharacterized protein V1510DRAFT_409870 [Dipodascopsis tothii]|uniref:uncharacterized protein n=1 Tax=Dipodascopsis tothii TaxID=44089 RepID=UPI0034CDBEBC